MTKAYLTTQVPADLRERVRAAVTGLRKVDPDYTLSQLVTDALTAHVSELERRHHSGVPWPYAPSDLRRADTNETQ